MAIFDFLRPPRDSSVEERLKELAARREAVLKELREIRMRVETAGACRTNMLLSASSDEDILIFDTTISRDRLREERLELAEAEIRDQITLLQRQRDVQAPAAALNRAAASIEKLESDLAAAVAPLAAILRGVKLQELPPETLKIDGLGLGPDRPASATNIGAVLLAEALFDVAPEFFEDRRGHSRVAREAGVEKILVVRRFDGTRLTSFFPGLSGEEVNDIAAAGPLASRLRALARAFTEEIPPGDRGGKQEKIQ